MFRPMLATDFEEGKLRFPYLATPKLDGIRCLVINGEARTRSLKPIPNKAVDAWFRTHGAALDGLDGELIVGDPTAKDVYTRTTSGIMRYDGTPAFSFLVFDLIDQSGSRPFTARATEAEAKIRAFPHTAAIWLPSQRVGDMTELLRFEGIVLGAGYEGAMLRHPDGRYKQGRATVNEGTLLKVKRTRDAEAIVIRVEEQMHNTNTASKNELGRTKRSSAKAGKVGKGTAGSLIVRGAPGQPFEGVEFGIGTGMDDELRAAIWHHRDSLSRGGVLVKYRYLEIGVKDAPRHPVFVGFRKEIDR